MAGRRLVINSPFATLTAHLRFQPMDTLVHLIVLLAVVGLLWWLFATYILPLLPPPLPVVITVVFVVLICVWLLETFVGFGGLRI